LRGQHGVKLWVAQMRGLLGGSMEIDVFKLYIDVLGSGDVCKVSRYMNRRPVVSWQVSAEYGVCNENQLLVRVGDVTIHH
jgi:hypothetical protein